MLNLFVWWFSLLLRCLCYALVRWFVLFVVVVCYCLGLMLLMAVWRIKKKNIHQKYLCMKMCLRAKCIYCRNKKQILSSTWFVICEIILCDLEYPNPFIIWWFLVSFIDRYFWLVFYRNDFKIGFFVYFPSCYNEPDDENYFVEDEVLANEKIRTGWNMKILLNWVLL